MQTIFPNGGKKSLHESSVDEEQVNIPSHSGAFNALEITL